MSADTKDLLAYGVGIILVLACFFVPWLIPLLLIIVFLPSTLREDSFQKPSSKYAKVDPFEDIKNILTKAKTEQLLTFLTMKHDYLSSQIWNTKRKQALAAAHYICESCGATNIPLECHHISGYKLIPNEPISNLRVLCRKCHEAEHTLHGFPQTLEDYYTWSHPITIRKQQ